MTTLLEKAKKISGFRPVIKTDEEIELALAWLKGEITSKQITSVIYEGKKTSRGNYLNWLALALRSAYMKGRLILK